MYALNNPIRYVDPDGMRVSLFDRMEALGAYHGEDYEAPDNSTQDVDPPSNILSTITNAISDFWQSLGFSKDEAPNTSETVAAAEEMEGRLQKGVDVQTALIPGGSLFNPEASGGEKAVDVGLSLFPGLGFVDDGVKGAFSIFSHISPKIARQIGNRGWTKELIHKTVNTAFTTRSATNRATGNAATAYFQKEGSYIVRDDVTGQVVQISNRLDPKWIPDASIINPYIPK